MTEKKTLVLLFEDEPLRREQLKRQLEEQDKDLEVIAPGSRYETYAAVRSDPTKFDLIVLDYHYLYPDEIPFGEIPDDVPPFPDGLTLCEEISKINPRVPIIVYGTWQPDLPNRHEALARGAYRVITAMEVPQLVHELRKPLQELVQIANALAEMQDNRRRMQHDVPGLGVGFQVIDTQGYIWFRDEEYAAVVGDSGRRENICYCKTHGYRLEHGMCTHCLVLGVADTGQPQLRIFYSPTYPGGHPGEARTAPVFQYLSVLVSPIPRTAAQPADSASSDEQDLPPAKSGRPGLAAIEAVSKVPHNFVQSWPLQEHLDILARALQDMGFKRVRIYRAARSAAGSQARLSLVGLSFHGRIQDGLSHHDVRFEVKSGPSLGESEKGTLSKVISIDEFLVRDEDRDALLLLPPRHDPAVVALFSGAGHFIGCVAVDNVDPDGPAQTGRPVTKADLNPQADDECIPASPMAVMDEIARVMAQKPDVGRDQPADILRAEREFEKIRMRSAASVYAAPPTLLESILEAVRAEIPQVHMAHIRSLEGDNAVSVASIGLYGRIAKKSLAIRESRRMMAIVARTGAPLFIDDAVSLGDNAPGYREFTGEELACIWRYPSHGVYPLLFEGDTIGTVSFQATEKAFFTGYRRRLFQMVANLLAAGLRDYRTYLQNAQAITADIAQRSARLVLHNLNQPVATIRQYVQLAERAIQKSPLSLDALKRYVAAIDQQCLRIIDIRKDFANLFGPIPEQLEVIDVQGFLTGLLGNLGLAERAIKPSVQVGPSVACVEARRRAMEVTLTVLLQNALDALAEHQGKRLLAVHVRPADPGAAAEAPFASTCIAVDVIDTGPGVSDGIRQHLFEPFHSTRRDGLGIGLACTRQILRALGGDVLFAEADPRGTRFTLLMPATPRKP